MQLLHGGAVLEYHCSVGEDDALVLGAGLRVLLAVVDAPTVKRSADSHSVLTTEPFFQKAEPKQVKGFDKLQNKDANSLEGCFQHHALPLVEAVV